jgi:hypothetical protein
MDTHSQFHAAMIANGLSHLGGTLNRCQGIPKEGERHPISGITTNQFSGLFGTDEFTRMPDDITHFRGDTRLILKGQLCESDEINKQNVSDLSVNSLGDSTRLSR